MHPLFRDMIYQNYWLWAHGFLALILAKFFLWFYTRKSSLHVTGTYVKQGKQKTVATILGIAIAWELLEWLTPMYWAGILDSTGDVLIAFLTALVFVL